MSIQKCDYYTTTASYIEDAEWDTLIIKAPFVCIPNNPMALRTGTYPIIITPTNEAILLTGDLDPMDLVAMYRREANQMAFALLPLGYKPTAPGLTVYTGFMQKRFKSAAEVPWADIREEVKRVDFVFSNIQYTVWNTDFWFYGFTNLETVGFQNQNQPLSITSSASHMFDGCEKLSIVTVRLKSGRCFKNAPCMFRNCASLTSLRLCNLNTGNIRDSSEMFYGCNNIETIKCKDFLNAENSENMFYGCTKLPNFDPNYVDATKATSETGGYLERCGGGGIIE